jgi:hypothetical protein
VYNKLIIKQELVHLSWSVTKKNYGMFPMYRILRCHRILQSKYVIYTCITG